MEAIWVTQYIESETPLCFIVLQVDGTWFLPYTYATVKVERKVRLLLREQLRDGSNIFHEFIILPEIPFRLKVPKNIWNIEEKYSLVNLIKYNFKDIKKQTKAYPIQMSVINTLHGVIDD